MTREPPSSNAAEWPPPPRVQSSTRGRPPTSSSTSATMTGAWYVVSHAPPEEGRDILAVPRVERQAAPPAARAHAAARAAGRLLAMHALVMSRAADPARPTYALVIHGSRAGDAALRAAVDEQRARGVRI